MLETFIKHARFDESTAVRRESVSAIGRLRSKKTIPPLFKFLKDQDPKVVMQAIRGLLVFSGECEVRNEISKLASHPNEVIKEVINKELNGSQYQSNNIEHNTFPNFMKNTVVNGDVQEILRYAPADSIHLTFTSPPYYNARDYCIYQCY